MRFDGEAVLRWTARILGSLIVLLYVVLFVGESIGASYAGLTFVDVLVLSTHALTVLGFVLAWRWPLGGGLLAVVGSGWRIPVILASMARDAGAVQAPTPFLLFFVVGILHVVDGLWLRRKLARPRPPRRAQPT